MNERFVAVSTVTGSRICGCFSKLRCNFSVTIGWQQMMNAIRWIKQFAEKSRWWWWWWWWYDACLLDDQLS